ncbi:hypothetical protein KKF34_11305 [Myxococcota bacterium]|nr:hypothetical protein [Myxococcota bacterium]MBU1380457.1 hypothetical protein [Myxococcota bacterium]MBU1497450.1 hypothetical protein [Myxococcota bacterium]
MSILTNIDHWIDHTSEKGRGSHDPKPARHEMTPSRAIFAEKRSIGGRLFFRRKNMLRAKTFLIFNSQG